MKGRRYHTQNHETNKNRQRQTGQKETKYRYKSNIKVITGDADEEDDEQVGN